MPGVGLKDIIAAAREGGKQTAKAAQGTTGTNIGVTLGGGNNLTGGTTDKADMGGGVTSQAAPGGGGGGAY